jgi:hypothetical protein
MRGEGCQRGRKRALRFRCLKYTSRFISQTRLKDEDEGGACVCRAHRVAACPRQFETVGALERPPVYVACRCCLHHVPHVGGSLHGSCASRALPGKLPLRSAPQRGARAGAFTLELNERADWADEEFALQARFAVGAHAGGMRVSGQGD